MKLLVTGGGGQLAHDISRKISMRLGGLRSEKERIVGYAPTITQLNICDPVAIDSIITKIKPDIIINTAAYTAVDKAESEATQAYQANCQGVLNLADACQKYHLPLIHLSTDYIFDGKSDIPYQEHFPASPLNVYGETKLQGENEIKKRLEKYIILRTSGVFGIHGHNFVKSIIRLAQNQDVLRIVADQKTCPTPSLYLAHVIIELAQDIFKNQSAIQWGDYHYSASDPISWHGFASEIIQLLKQYEPVKVKEVIPISASEYNAPAKRPANAVLNCRKIFAEFGIRQESWRFGLKYLMSELLYPKTLINEEVAYDSL